MLNWLWALIMLASLVGGLVTGQLDQVSNALLRGGGDAINLTLTLAGAMCLWGGLLRIADKGGFTAALSRALRPVLRLLFPSLDPAGPACRAMLMNMAANLLGLGNAATPLGLAAMRELERDNPHPGTATRPMIVFVVLNTASIQLLPTTVATLRLQYGAAAPLNILPCVWIVSAASAVTAVALAKLLGRRQEMPPALGRRQAPAPEGRA